MTAHAHDGDWTADCPACNRNDAKWRRQLRQQADYAGDLETLLAELSRAPRAQDAESSQQMLHVDADVMARIDEFGDDTGH